LAGTLLKAGTQTLSVTFTPADTTDYTTAKATVALTVNKATPAITWATPTAITYGTALSATQLDATSKVAGTFVYTPGLGTVLKAGTQTLSLTFTPTDATDYAIVQKSVQITVSPVPAVLLSPKPGSTLTGTSATFTWSAGGGVSAYELRLGTTGIGSSNVYNSAGASTTALTTRLVSNIPTTSQTLYARLYSYINGAWQYNDYTYKEF
jgi:hypothetical protein